MLLDWCTEKKWNDARKYIKWLNQQHHSFSVKIGRNLDQSCCTYKLSIGVGHTRQAPHPTRPNDHSCSLCDK